MTPAGPQSKPPRAAAPPTRRAPQSPPRRRPPALLGAMVTSIVCVGVLFVGPFPVRTWWTQRTRAEALQKQINVLDAANAKLRTKRRELNDPATIEGLARRDFDMVHKGDSAYAISPPPVPSTDLPAVWPFVQLDRTQPASVGSGSGAGGG